MNTPSLLADADLLLVGQHTETVVSRWLSASQEPNALIRRASRSALFEPAAAAVLSAGKRMRPLLCLWAWRTATETWDSQTPIPDTILAVSCATEMLHAASLVIDDIQDGSLLRRGEPSAHARFGIPVAINAANWMYFEAMDLLAHAGVPTTSILKMMQECHEGQALDLATATRDVIMAAVDAQEDEVSALYERIATQKTAALMKFGVAAVLDVLREPGNGRSDRAQKTLSLLELYGLLYQKADDLRNINTSLSGAKTNEDFGSVRNYVAVTLIQSLSALERKDLLSATTNGTLKAWLLAHPRFETSVRQCAAVLQVDLDRATALARELNPQAAGLAYLDGVIHGPVSALIRHARAGVEKRGESGH